MVDQVGRPCRRWAARSVGVLRWRRRSRARRPRSPVARGGSPPTAAVMLPTADAFEEPGALVATATTWAERLDVEIEALMVMQRPDADDAGGRRSRRRSGSSTSPATLRCTCAACSRTPPCSPPCGARSSAAASSSPSVRRRRRSATRCSTSGAAGSPRAGLETGVAIIPESENWSDEALTARVAGNDADDRAADGFGGHLPWRDLGAARWRGRHRRPRLTATDDRRARRRARRRFGRVDHGGRSGRWRVSSSSPSSSPPATTARTTAMSNTAATAAAISTPRRVIDRRRSCLASSSWRSWRLRP